MTKEKFAKHIATACEYGSELTREDQTLAEQHGLVVVYGYSDDNMVFAGAINDEVGCWNGGIAYLDENGLFQNECEDESCPYALKELEKCKTIEAIWNDDGKPPWTYETEIPHATFNVYEDGEVWCVGIVFELAALRTEGA